MKPKSKLLSLLLTICLVVGLMPTAAFAAGTDTGKAIQLVDSGTAANIGGGQADNIYFGTYQQSSDGSGGYNTDPIKWRVLENADGQLFLLSDQNLDVFQYHTDSESVTWEKSTMRSWLNGYDASHNTGGDSGIDYTSDNFIGTAFSEKEQKAIADTTVVNDDNPTYGTEGGENTNDKIFLLSIAEANNDSYFADNNSRIATNTAYAKEQGAHTYSSTGAGDWWLRSPGYGDIDAALVDGDGCLYRLGFSVGNIDVCVRPAFNLNLNSVLFTSAAEGGKSASSMDSGLTAVNDYTGNEWKLTLLDSSRNFSISDAKIEESKIDFSYSNAQTGTNEYISVVIEDNGAITHYGRILQLDGTANGASGTASLTLPADVTLGGNTKLYVFNEQYNGDYKTDYASQLKKISPTVDTTAPTLTAGSATRDSETAATVKFTSDEAGSYYYKVVNSGENQPTINTTGAGTSCVSDENTISLTSLSGAGAKDIYIVAKDAVGNVSQTLQIVIPEFIPTYTISASPAALNFSNKTVGYTEAPDGQTVTITNTGNQTVTVTLPTSTNYTITAGTGFVDDTATLAPNGTAKFTVQPNTGLDAGSHSETLTISDSNGASASVELSFAVNAVYTLTVELNGGSGSTTGGEYAEGTAVPIDAGSRSNYRFNGWTSSNGGSFANASSANTTFTMPAADTTITAAWSYIGGGGSTTDYYRLTFETNGGSEISSIRRAEYTTIDLTDYTPTREGYEFTGWYADENLTEKITSIRLTRNTTVYAGWEEIKENPSTGFENPFTDVSESDWFFNDVKFVYQNGLMNGTSATTFSPEGTTSRGMIVTILWRMAGSPDMEDKIWGYPFADVDATAYYGTAVYWARLNGIAGGYDDATFGPNDPITREQMAAILYRYAQYKGYDVSAKADLNKFTDVDEISNYALEALQWANAEGLINGKGDGVLDPKGQATRAEAAAILMRFNEVVAE